MNILIILNDAPYGSERSYNGLRLAKALGDEETQVTLFLLSDAVACAKQEQKVPAGFYNLELMLKSVLRRGEVLACGMCMDARGLRLKEMVPGVERSSMDELAKRTRAADRVLVF
jgi:Uncharacterized conserved protein involved in intracellular sulfur reduction